MLFEGFPSVAGYAVIAGGIYAIVRLTASGADPAPSHPNRSRSSRRLRSSELGLAAIQVLPFLHRIGLIDLAYRHQTTGDHLPLRAILTLAIPDALGSPVDRQRYWGPLNYIEIQSFIGASALVLIAVAAARCRSLHVTRGVRTYLWTGAAITGMLLFVGGPMLAILERLPLFDTNYIGRLRSVFGFFLAALAAMGIEAASDGRSESAARTDRLGRVRRPGHGWARLGLEARRE